MTNFKRVPIAAVREILQGALEGIKNVPEDQTIACSNTYNLVYSCINVHHDAQVKNWLISELNDIEHG